MGQNQQSQPQQSNQNDNFMNNLQSFAKNFSGDPKQQAMNLMRQSGMDQNAINNAIQQTNQIYNMLKGGK